MLSPNAKRALLQSSNSSSNKYYSKENQEFNIPDDKIKSFANDFSILNIGSSFLDFYFLVGFTPAGKGEELYNYEDIIDDIESCKQDVQDEVLPKGVGTRFLRFTSIEGGGSYFYDVETDAVYDCDFGEEYDMVSGDKDPWFTSFYDFLEWYYSE